VEGAGGVLVPLNSSDFVIDLVQPDYKIIIVSRHYLGSINHTLLTIEAIKNRGFTIGGIIFNGNENIATESLILNYSKLKFIGRINDKNVIAEYADLFREKLLEIK
jgi:dethiobiotin synthetase